MTSPKEDQQPMTTREGITCYERDETLCNDRMCLRTGCRLRNERLTSRHADDYEKRIREKVWSSKCLTNGEWVYLVGLFQTARDHENCGDQPSRPDAGGNPPAAVESASSDPPDRREIVARETCSDCGYREPCDEKCPNCNDANEYGDYEGPTCEVCGGTGRFPGRSGNQGQASAEARRARRRPRCVG